MRLGTNAHPAHPRLGVWLELLAEDPAAVAAAHPHYIAVPGGQVFAVVPLG